MNPYVVTLPDLGEGLTSGVVVAWLVAAGERVKADQPLAEVETDKAVVQIPAPVAGTVVALSAAEGDRVAVGQPLVELHAEHGTGPVRAMPSVRALADELGVDLAALAPTGRPVTEDDVRARAREGRPHLAAAGRMSAAAAIPSVTVAEECDFGSLADEEDPYQRGAAIAGAVLATLPEHRALNATYEGGRAIEHERCDLGYAVQGARGLVVPVIRDAGSLAADRLAAELKRVVTGARGSALTPEDLGAGTFTITDARRLGGLFATPLLNPPQVAILGVHRVRPRAVVRHGQIVARPVGVVSVTFDHRALDGAQAAAFMMDVIDRIQSARPAGA